MLQTLFLIFILLQWGGTRATDKTGSERARQLLKAPQLSHTQQKDSNGGLLDSKLQAGPMTK